MISNENVLREMLLKEYEVVQTNQRTLNNQSIAALGVILATIVTALNYNNDLVYAFFPTVTWGLALLAIYIRTIMVHHHQYLNYLESRLDNFSGIKDTEVLQFERKMRPQIDKATLRLYGAGTWFYVLFSLFIVASNAYATVRACRFLDGLRGPWVTCYVIYTVFIFLVFVGIAGYSTYLSQRMITKRLKGISVPNWCTESKKEEDLNAQPAAPADASKPHR